MTTTTLLGFIIAGAITLYCLVFLWRMPVSLLTKVFWTLACFLLPGIGTWMMIEFYLALLPTTAPRRPRQPTVAERSPHAPPALLAGFLAICGLLYGGVVATGGVAAVVAERTAGWPLVVAGFSLLAFGIYFLKRGSRQLARLGDRAAA